mmetsp:Transcript_34323/g.113596  ORF Transcript_34323/g.113596 Transcript_34323/m.113596 type:complete len:473 (-) Transcript_34323:344-1762(-)
MQDSVPQPASGLTALSAQLRHHRQQAAHLQLQKERLERQLRIALEMRGGLSVAQLAAALREACSTEASGELRARVAELELHLESGLENRSRSMGGCAELAIQAAEHRAAQAEVTASSALSEVESMRKLQQSTLKKLEEADGACGDGSLAAAAHAEASAAEVAALREKLAAASIRYDLSDARVEDLEGQLKSLYFAFSAFITADVKECASQAADLRANLEAADLVLARRLSHGEGWQPTSAHAPHGPPLRVSGASLSLAQSDAPPTPAKGNAMSNQGGECSGAGSSDEGIGGCGGGRVGVNVGAVEAGSDGVSEVVNNAQTAPSNEPIDPREDTSLQLGELLGGRSLQSLQGLLQVKSSSGSLAKSAKRIVVLRAGTLAIFGLNRLDRPVAEFVLDDRLQILDIPDAKPRRGASFPYVFKVKISSPQGALTPRSSGLKTSRVQLTCLTFAAESRVEKATWMQILMFERLAVSG